MAKLTREIENAIIENAVEVAFMARDLYALSTRPIQTVPDPDDYQVAMSDMAHRGVQVAERVLAMEGVAERADPDLFEVEAMALGISALAVLSREGVGGVCARGVVGPRYWLSDEGRYDEYRNATETLAGKLYREFGNECTLTDRWYALYSEGQDNG